ncbi:MAG: ASKHA domain-containing protein [Actinomycetota bacterium]|nr:ASKHA domain-containing protein [Actinomycetota bacterium]MDA2999555.1 ASKHA domain-containing protein [Actinomycetota bacterium]
MTASNSHRIVFTPSGLDGVVGNGTTVLDAARKLGADIDSVCGGRGICGRCQITPSFGSFSKWGIDAVESSLSERSEGEIKYKGKRALVEGNRLGCMAKVCGDMVIDVPAMSQVHRQIVRKDLDLGVIVIDPTFSLFYVAVTPSELGDDVTASQIIRDAVAQQHGLSRPTISNKALSQVNRAIDKGDGGATIAIKRSDIEGVAGNIVAAWPGFVETTFGIAIDIGSTTVAGHLIDLTTGEVMSSSGVMNPQIRFGEDLMSRVSYVMMNKGGEKELTTVIRNAINDLVHDLADKADITTDKILEVVMVGNPIMHHILLGIDPTPLGAAPFVLATSEATTGAAVELDIHLPNASFYVGPCIAGHVGADTAAAILSEGPHRGSSMQLLIDVGTNAEIVLGDTTRQFAASSPTGPAFEGAQLSCGQRATAGAIEKVRIDPVTLEPRFRAIGIDMWSDEPGFSEAVQDTPVTGVCGSGIIEVIAEMYLAGIISQDGVVQGSLVDKTPRVVADERTFSYLLYENGDTKLFITQNDIRAIQLAKAALRAGIDLLVEHAGSPEVHDIRLAGAFGAHIDPTYAMVLGLVPDCPLPGVRSVGNSAGTGAAKALLSRAQRREMEHTVTHVTKIETATEPRFQDLFVAAMAFPHASAPMPYLSTLVTLPPRIESSGDSAGGGQRRRRRV